MIFDLFRQWNFERQAQRDEVAAMQAELQAQRVYEAEAARRAAFDREQQIVAVRVITGDLKHRYAILDTVRGFGLYNAQPGEDYDPTEATRRALYSLQVQAMVLGADAIIHASFQVLRYTEQRYLRTNPVPVYEVHAFGTAVKIVGPPVDWHLDAQEDNPANSGTYEY